MSPKGGAEFVCCCSGGPIACPPQQIVAPDVPIGEVGSRSSLHTFSTSGVPTWCRKLIWSKHKRWVHNSVEHSVVLLFSSETFWQNVLQEPLDTIKRSCTKDHQKSHRTHQRSKQGSVHRVSDGLTKTSNRNGSTSSVFV